MKLSQKQFGRLLQKKKLALSLIGMSNIGKTHWSGKFTKLHFRHFSCNSLVEEKLAPELKALGYSGIKDVSRWMGQPYDARFSLNQKKYLNCEKEVMKNILAELKNIKKQNIVIDTTGSFVHLNAAICSELKRKTLVIYIAATDKMREDMFQRYIKNPKPVVFGDIFLPKAGETGQETLRRCYPKLLSKRSKLYAKYADVVIPYEFTEKNMDIRKFILLIKKQL
jgi:shikimate kinase